MSSTTNKWPDQMPPMHDFRIDIAFARLLDDLRESPAGPSTVPMQRAMRRINDYIHGRMSNFANAVLAANANVGGGALANNLAADAFAAERRSFEVWATPFGYKFDTFGGTQAYSRPSTIRVWEGWSARAALPKDFYPANLTEQEKFEKWVLEGQAYKVTKWGSTQAYADTATSQVWSGWSARASMADSVPWAAVEGDEAVEMDESAAYVAPGPEYLKGWNECFAMFRGELEPHGQMPEPPEPRAFSQVGIYSQEEVRDFGHSCYLQGRADERAVLAANGLVPISADRQSVWLEGRGLVALKGSKAEASSANPAAVLPKGWKIVPEEPTPEMVEAANECEANWKSIWPAMLEVAPPAPTTVAEKGTV